MENNKKGLSMEEEQHEGVQLVEGVDCVLLIGGDPEGCGVYCSNHQVLSMISLGGGSCSANCNGNLLPTPGREAMVFEGHHWLPQRSRSPH